MIGDEPQLLSSDTTSLTTKEKLIMAAYEAMLEEWEAYQRPNGKSADVPAVTCSHMFSHHPEAESGIYYIDPNEGSNYDSFQVFCNAQERSTCVFPKIERFPIENHRPVSRNGHSWWSEIGSNDAMVFIISFSISLF